jgi:F-type H+-transporting ATPase subunit a
MVLEGKGITAITWIIEGISYVTRIVSLSVRITLNVVCGHILIKIIISMGTILIKGKYVIMGGIVYIIISGIMILEIGIANIQYYIYGILIEIYSE